jgi:hypothetical protein
MGKNSSGGAGCDAGEGSRRWEMVPTGGPHLSASERKRKEEEGELGRQLDLMGCAAEAWLLVSCWAAGVGPWEDGR